MSKFGDSAIHADASRLRPSRSDSIRSSARPHDQRPELVWSVSEERILELLMQGLDIGLAALHHTGNAAALKLTAISTTDNEQENDRLRTLHTLPGFAEASPTSRWAVNGLATVWSEEHGARRPNSATHYLRLDPNASGLKLPELVAQLPTLWSSVHRPPHLDSPSEETWQLVLRPASGNPLQLYRIPFQRFGDHKLSLMARHHILPHLQHFRHHFYYHEALVLPKSLENLYTECSKCAKAVPVGQMSKPCLFHPGESWDDIQEHLKC